MNRPEYTQDQINDICSMIGEWYLIWKRKIAPGQHNLGIAKEMLKEMLFPSEQNKEFINNPDAKFHLQEARGISRDNVPGEDETIADAIDLETLRKYPKMVKEIEVYLRKGENWMIELLFLDGNRFYVKLPHQMTKEQVANFAKPLMDVFPNNSH